MTAEARVTPEIQQKANSMRADPSPFTLKGGPVGLLLVHGFTGSPGEVRPVAEELHRRGLTVHAPLLPGHGTMPEDLNTRHWEDLADAVETAYESLRAECRVAFLAGLSMGSLLSLHFAAHHPGLPGVITCSPAIGFNDPRQRLLPIARYFVSAVSAPQEDSGEYETSWFCYDVYPIPAAYQLSQLIGVVKREMARVTCPILIIYSTGDRAIRQDGPQRLYEAVGSKDKELVTLHNTGHVITAGREWPAVADRIYRFIEAHSPHPLIHTPAPRAP
jgi:carboxylesterase